VGFQEQAFLTFFKRSYRRSYTVGGGQIIDARVMCCTILAV